jgi:hypothetical protein
LGVVRCMIEAGTKQRQCCLEEVGCQAASIIGRIEKDATNNRTCGGYDYGGKVHELEDALDTASGPRQPCSRGDNCH